MNINITDEMLKAEKARLLALANEIEAYQPGTKLPEPTDAQSFHESMMELFNDKLTPDEKAEVVRRIRDDAALLP